MALHLNPFRSIPSPPIAPARSGAVSIGTVRFAELRQVATLQQRAFAPRLAYSLTTLLLLWSLPYVRFLVARQDGCIAGCAIGDRNGGQARVVNICVDPDFQRRGIGAQLLRALDAAIPRGDMILMVETENETAKALYRREGFTEVGISKNYYGRGLDGIWMQKVRDGSSPARVRI